MQLRARNLDGVQCQPQIRRDEYERVEGQGLGAALASVNSAVIGVCDHVEAFAGGSELSSVQGESFASMLDSRRAARVANRLTHRLAARHDFRWHEHDGYSALVFARALSIWVRIPSNMLTIRVSARLVLCPKLRELHAIFVLETVPEYRGL